MKLRDSVDAARALAAVVYPDDEWTQLLAHFGELDDQELDVLELLIERLKIGRDRYGPLDVDAARNWPAEKLDEALDRALYTVFEDMRELRERGRLQRTKAQKDQRGTVAAHFTVGRDGSVTQHEHPGLWAEVNAFAFEAQDTSVWLHLPCGRLWVLLRKEPLRCRACEVAREVRDGD